MIENLQTRDQRLWTRTKSARGKSRRRTRGFTLLELIIVMAIIAILLEIAIPIYSRSILATRERALRTDLASLRQAIWRFTLDKQKGPQGLDDLRAAGYIGEIPNDPMTDKPDWEPEPAQENVLLSPDQQDPGITDVHSASNATSSDGTAYSSW